MATNAMKLLNQRRMSTKVELMVWSNKLDLLALSNAKGEVLLYRLTWQKVWSLNPPSEGTSAKGIAWRPDGKVIAVGYSNNDLMIVCVETGEIIHKTNINTNGEDESVISYMNWLEEKPSSPDKYTYKDVADLFLPKLEPISKNFGAMNEESESTSFEDSKKVTALQELNILVVGYTKGELRFMVFGIFSTGLLRLPSDAGPILEVDFIDDLSKFFVLVLHEGQMKVAVFDTQILVKLCHSLHTIGCKFGQIMSLMDYMENTMNAITEAYENIVLLEVESKLAQYASKMPPGTVSADFLELLMFGFVSVELELFLLKDLSDKGIKKLDSAIELSHTNIQRLVLKHLQAVAHMLALHLCDLYRTAESNENFKEMGLDNVAVYKSFIETGSMLVKTSEVLHVIDDSLKKYKALFKWLHDVVVRMSEERVTEVSLPNLAEHDTSFIAEYLYNFEGPVVTGEKGEQQPQDVTPRVANRCYLDRLGQYIKDQDLIDPIPPETNPWECFLKENPCIRSNPSIIPRHSKMSLIQQYKCLRQVVNEAFTQPHGVMSEKVTLSKIIELPGDETVVHSPRGSLRYMNDDKRLVVAFVSHPRAPYLTYSAQSFDTDHIPLVSIRVDFHQEPESAITVLDLQFYSREALSVLVEEKRTGAHDRLSLFGQLPLESVHDMAMQRRPPQCIDGCQLIEPGKLRVLDNVNAYQLAVSGARKVAVFLSEDHRYVRTYEMDVEVEDDEDEDDMDVSREGDIFVT